jgi:hypothetical protein
VTAEVKLTVDDLQQRLEEGGWRLENYDQTTIKVPLEPDACERFWVEGRLGEMAQLWVHQTGQAPAMAAWLEAVYETSPGRIAVRREVVRDQNVSQLEGGGTRQVLVPKTILRLVNPEQRAEVARRQWDEYQHRLARQQRRTQAWTVQARGRRVDSIVVSQDGVQINFEAGPPLHLPAAL